MIFVIIVTSLIVGISVGFFLGVFAADSIHKSTRPSVPPMPEFNSENPLTKPFTKDEIAHMRRRYPGFAGVADFIEMEERNKNGLH